MAIPLKRQVLVIDDDPGVRDSVAMLLMSAGYDVATAEDGLAALSHLNKTTTDVIVSDLNMPRMSGFDLLSEVRRIKRKLVDLRQIRILVLDEADRM